MKISRLLSIMAMACVASLCGQLHAENSEPITNPEGRTVSYSKAGIMHYPFSIYMTNERYDWYAAEVVFGEDNTVYFKNPFNNFKTDTYLKGTIEGNKITVQFPQLIDRKDGKEYYAYRAYYDYSGDPTYRIDSSDKLILGYEDGVITMEKFDPRTGIGVFDQDKKWCKVAETEQVYTPFAYELLTPPADMKTEKWAVHHLRGDYAIEVGFYGDECWIKGIASQIPEGWIKGTVTEGAQGIKRLTIPTAQYVGISPYSTQTFFMAAKSVFVSSTDFYLDAAQNIELNYYEKGGKLTPSSDAAYVIQSGTKTVLDVVEYYAMLSFERQSQQELAEPMTPEIVYVESYSEIAEIGKVQFSIPAMDVNGMVYDPTKLSYQLYIDGELYTFEADKYDSLDEDTTEIPYVLHDGYDFQVVGQYHTCNYHKQPLRSIGVVTKYVDGDIVLTSQMGLYELSGIESVEAVPALAEEYYDMQGRKVSGSEPGMYIQVLRFADGTSKSVKVKK